MQMNVDQQTHNYLRNEWTTAGEADKSEQL